MSAATEPALDPAELSPEDNDLRPGSPRLLILTEHPAVAERTRAVARELARILVTQTLLEMGVLAANDNSDHAGGQ